MSTTRKPAAPPTLKIKARPQERPSAVQGPAGRRRSTAAGRSRKSQTVQSTEQSGRWTLFLRFALPILLCTALGAGLGAGAKAVWTWLTRSPRFAIRELVIRTGPRVSAREVRTLADLEEGDNILGFRLADCVKALEIHPWVKRAAVMRELPDRVVIEIKEREPVAVITLRNLYYVDPDGEIFKKLIPGEDRDYPLITGLSLAQVVENKNASRSLIQLALQLIDLARVSRILPLSEISELHLDPAAGLTVVRAGDGLRINFGKNNFADKWIRLERTLGELGDEAQKVAELDLNFEGRATIRFRGGYRLAAAEEGEAGN